MNFSSLFLFGVCCLCFATGLKNFQPCKKSEDDYSACLLKKVEQNRKNLIKGIPKLNFPAVDPLDIPFMYINRSIGSVVSVESILRNVIVTGGKNTVIKSLKFDPHHLTGEIHLVVPWQYLTAEYNVSGGLISIPLQSKGFTRSNFSKTEITLSGNAKIVDKQGIKYYQVDKMNTKLKIDGGYTKMVSKNPNLQFAADVIMNFFNSNTRLVIDTVMPIVEETANEVFREIIDQIFDSLPAAEWLPE